MYTLNRQIFEMALKAKGYSSVGDFAKALGMHRNTIYHYLVGNSVFAPKFGQLLQALDLNPADALVRRDSSRSPGMQDLAPLIDRIHEEFPDVTLVLFGSRARGTAARYADWDIGVYCAAGLPHILYRKIRRRIADLVEDGSPYLMDVVNLNQADEAFVREASRGWMFLTGKQKDWLALQGRVAA